MYINMTYFGPFGATGKGSGRVDGSREGPKQVVYTYPQADTAHSQKELHGSLRVDSSYRSL